MPYHDRLIGLDWDAALDRALEGEGVRAVYQPIVDLNQRTVVGYEALTRFDLVDGTSPTPDRWFALARERGLTTELEAIALRKALAERPHLPGNCFLAINVEPESLRAPLVREVLLDEGDLTGLVIEITEHAPWSWDELEPSVTALRARGALFAVDDAGAGYSGLQQILELRPSILKLDRAIVHGVAKDEAKVALVEMIGLFASRVDAWVVAEGIETIADAERLADMEIPLAQGYLFGPPGAPWPVMNPDVAAQLGSFADQSTDTLHRLIEIIPTLGSHEDRLAAWAHTDAEWVAVIDERHRPLGLVDPTAALAGELITTLHVNVNLSPAGVANRLSAAAQPPGAPVIVTDDQGRYVGVIGLRRLLGRLSAEVSKLDTAQLPV